MGSEPSLDMASRASAAPAKEMGAHEPEHRPVAESGPNFARNAVPAVLPPGRDHVSAGGDTPPAQRGSRVAMLKRLQRSHGNRFVQRMVSRPDALAREEAARAAGGRPIFDAGTGQALDERTRRYMASRFGRDLGDVRVHRDEGAAQAADALGAEAFATGRDLYFARGRYAPDTDGGRHLLAHELTHVVQQANSGAPSEAAPRPDDAIVIGAAADPQEREADRIADEVSAGAARVDVQPQPLSPDVVHVSLKGAADADRKPAAAVHRPTGAAQGAATVTARAPGSDQAGKGTDQAGKAGASPARRRAAQRKPLPGSASHPVVHVAAGAARHPSLFETEVGEPPARHPEPESPDEPFTLDPVEVLTVQPLTAVYGAPLALAPDALRLPPVPTSAADASADRDRAAQAEVRETYAAAARSAKDRHDSLVREANAALDSMRADYAVKADHVVPLFADALSQLDQKVERNRAALDGALIAADAELEAAWRKARTAIFGTASGAHARLTAAAKKADADIKTIVNDIFAPFGKTVEQARKLCADKGAAAIGSTKSFEPKLPTGNCQELARAEAMSKAAPQAVADSTAQLTKAVADNTTQYNELGKTTHDQIAKNAEPPLVKYKARIDDEGQKAVTKAMQQALRQINAQARDARGALRDIHANARAQLSAQRRAARGRLQAQAKTLAQALRGEANAALGALINGVRASLPGYERPLDRLADSLARAAGQGTDALTALARRSAPDIERSLALAHRQQAERIAANRRDAPASLDRHEAESKAGIVGELASTGQALDEAFRGAEAAMLESTTKQEKAFLQAAATIARTADGWAKPISQVFPTYVKDAVEANKQSHTTWEAEVHKGRDGFVAQMERHIPAGTHLMPQLEEVAGRLMTRLGASVGTLKAELRNKGWYQNISEAAVTGALHGLTKAQGAAIEEMYGAPGNLRADLTDKLWEADRNAAISYLNGDRVAGAAWELKASVHWYNDEEDRIEKIQRDLTPAERKQLGNTELGPGPVNDARNALGGTDRSVFDALQMGNDARADAYRMRDKILDARRRGDDDAFNKVLAEYSKAPEDLGRVEMSANERRLAVQQGFAAIMAGVAADQPAAAISKEDAEKKLIDFALQDIKIPRPPPPRGAHDYVDSEYRTLKVEGAQRDLAIALIQKGEGSVEARTARIGVELQRPGKPEMVNLDTALIDPRLNPNFHQYSPEERKAALKEREEVFAGVAKKYMPGGTSEKGEALPQDKLEEAFRKKFGDDHLKADVAGRWIKETVPSPDTAAMAIRVGIQGLGTDEELVNRTVDRMNRDEIAEMQKKYREQTKSADEPNGRDLYADLGVFGHKKDWFNEFSGDEALKLEVKLLGIPRNERERAEVAFLQVQQQLEETGFLGKALAKGTSAEADLHNDYAKLIRASGGTVKFDDQGVPHWTGGMFDEAGNYTGTKKHELSAAIQFAQLSAENYAAKIDSYANAATMGIAIVGAIVAAVVTVATGGAASPLLLAAIAGITGLAGMAAHAAISGGRYGWEQAAVDLGMTAVQALTAGVGASLGLASRGGAEAVKAGMKGLVVSKELLTGMGRLTGKAFTDMVVIGAATGGLNALGQTALTEQTWSKGFDHAFDELMEGLLRGALSGAATAAVSQAFEAIPAGKVVGNLPRATLGTKLGESTNVALRGGLKAVSSGLGGFAGRGVELGFEKATGRYTGDAGDIFQESLEAGAHAAAQGLGEGAAEARAHAYHVAREQARTPPTPVEKTPAPVAKTQPELPFDQPSMRTSEQAAAGIGGSRFTGDSAARLRLEPATINEALAAGGRLVEPGGALAGKAHIPDPGNPSVITVRAANDETVEVQLRVVKELPRSADGEMPVARYQLDPTSGKYTIEISSGAAKSVVERALAHELSEIRAVHGAEGTPADALAEGSSARKLSPHDEGRLAELEVIARQLREADPQQHLALLDEAQRLVAHLGLTGEEQAAAARKELAKLGLQDRPDALALLEQALGMTAGAPLRAPRQATEEGSFADFDSLIKELRNSPLGYELEAAKRQTPEALAEDLVRTRGQVDAAAHAAARRQPPPGRVPGAEIQHQTKTLDVTVKLPAGIAPLHPDVINENLMWLQSRRNGRATLLHVGPDGQPTRYFIEEDTPGAPARPRGRVGDVGAPGEQFELFGAAPARGVREPDYGTEHKFMDNYLTPAVAKQIAEARRAAGLPPLDPRMLAIAAGEEARWIMEGMPGSTRAGVVVEVGRGTAEPKTGPELPPEPQLELPFDQPSMRTGEQTAAGIIGSRFTGDSAARLRLEPVTMNAALAATERLTGAGGALAGKAHVPDPDNPSLIAVKAANGETVEVQLRIVEELPRSADGEMPVARYQLDPTSGKYTIEISGGAPKTVVERALAHELSEIRAVHGTEGTQADALARRSSASKLSPHDEGRLAELEVIARQMREADPDKHLALLDEAQRLVAHLGLTGEDQAIAARKELAKLGLQDRPEALALLDQAIGTASKNPFLQRPTGEFIDDLQLFARRREHASSLGEDRSAAQALEQARRMVLAEGLVKFIRGDKSIWPERVEALRKSLPPEVQKFLNDAIREAERGGPSAPVVDPGEFDPHTVAAVHADFGDRAQFQDWPEFKRRYFEAYQGQNSTDPKALQRAFDRWAQGSYVSSEKTTRSLLSDTTRPDPGYEHRFVSDPLAHEALSLKAGQKLLAGGVEITVDDAVTRRNAAIEQRRTLRLELTTTQDSATRIRLEGEINALIGKINVLSEALGLAAGRAYAASAFPEGKILEIPRSGAGVPDLLVELADGSFVVIECKGGQAELGTRLSADNRLRVEQGTRAYLESLAQTMEGDKDATISDYGKRLRLQLASDARGLRYFLARRPFDESGNPAPPEIGEFDIRLNR